MKSNNIVIAHPTSEDQLGATNAFLSSLNIQFEVSNESTYNQNFVKKIKKVQKSKNRTEIDPTNVWGSLGLR
jgi:hypothetical protein